MVDKVYVMFHSLFTKNNYNIKKAWDDFYQLESSKDIVDEIDRNFGEGLQNYINSYYKGENLELWEMEDITEEFKEWSRGHSKVHDKTFPDDKPSKLKGGALSGSSDTSWFTK